MNKNLNYFSGVDTASDIDIGVIPFHYLILILKKCDPVYVTYILYQNIFNV